MEDYQLVQVQFKMPDPDHKQKDKLLEMMGLVPEQYLIQVALFLT